MEIANATGSDVASPNETRAGAGTMRRPLGKRVLALGWLAR
jgi:hypothetical protein